jgi:hypothetical protein
LAGRLKIAVITARLLRLPAPEEYDNKRDETGSFIGFVPLFYEPNLSQRR